MTPTHAFRLLALAALAFSGCRYVTTGAAPAAEEPVAAWQTPVSAVHYRAFADADALAAYLRWTPGAPVLVSAHRGGPAPGFPENALPTFERALNYAPALIEADVRRTADGRLVLLPDETLDRTTTGTGPLSARSFADLRRLRLRDPLGQITPFRIPTLDEALAWADGRAVLMLDVKPDVPPEEVVAAVRQMRAENRAVVITYSFDDWNAYLRLASDLVYSVTAETPAEAEHLMLTGPFPGHRRELAFAGVGVPDPALVEHLHRMGLRVQAATFGDVDAEALRDGPAAYAPFLDAGVDVLVTDEVEAAALATRPAP